MPQPA
jgi:hypothetical protein